MVTIKTDISITATPKGHRVWLETLGNHGFPVGTKVSIEYTDKLIVITKDTNGKRSVSSPSKNGVIDLQSNKVSRWAQDSTVAHVAITDNEIVIQRGN
jgi:hypothetical protein